MSFGENEVIRFVIETLTVAAALLVLASTRGKARKKISTPHADVEVALQQMASSELLPKSAWSLTTSSTVRPHVAVAVDTKSAFRYYGVRRRCEIISLKLSDWTPDWWPQNLHTLEITDEMAPPPLRCIAHLKVTGRLTWIVPFLQSYTGVVGKLTATIDTPWDLELPIPAGLQELRVVSKYFSEGHVALPCNDSIRSATFKNVFTDMRMPVNIIDLELFSCLITCPLDLGPLESLRTCKILQTKYHHTCECSLFFFPQGLEQLSFSSDTMESLPGNLGQLPTRLKALIIADECFDATLYELPQELEVLDLRLCEAFSTELGRLPTTLRKLMLPPSYRKALDGGPSQQLLMHRSYDQRLKIPFGLSLEYYGSR
ncbi:hypothetical protein JKP88DRAFT_272963 [Tribonema minus]|uniref:Uncharacterized protein n=1 Tax=Tribonema minus TaxID=303371 RepID=A0A835YY88_9STRA|nr:hypothetical protein JKP88DRAFT_272963 [Tribonema minus]